MALTLYDRKLPHPKRMARLSKTASRQLLIHWYRRYKAAFDERVSINQMMQTVRQWERGGKDDVLTLVVSVVMGYESCQKFQQRIAHDQTTIDNLHNTIARWEARYFTTRH